MGDMGDPFKELKQVKLERRVDRILKCSNCDAQMEVDGLTASKRRNNTFEHGATLLCPQCAHHCWIKITPNEKRELLRREPRDEDARI